MIIMMSTACYAFTTPHDFACGDCHGKFPEAGNDNSAMRSSNMCLACHNTTAQATRMPINPGDMSNYFGTVAGQPDKGSRSSHTWNVVASYQNYTASFSQEPQNSALNYGWNSVSYVKKVVCVRCHNEGHTGSVASPFLRATNVNDALCLDCHRSRKESDLAVSLGTHPVSDPNLSMRPYSSIYKNKSTALRRTPLSPNSNNPTAKLGNYFKTGRLVCTTCHAPHYADSSSATLDNRSTANGFALDNPALGLKGKMQDSNGLLLRTDQFGATANAINACSSCHKETKNLNHNGNGQNIQCGHCHGAHVREVTDTDATVNQKLVRRDFSNMSTAKIKLGANKKVFYKQSTALRFVRSDNKGICQVCHTPTHGVDFNATKDSCLLCHTHANGFSAVNCTACHGQPPIADLVSGPNGKSSQDYSLNEANTPHATHASKAYYDYACKNCHYDGTKVGYHNTGTGSFTDVFIDTTGSVGDQVGLTKNSAGNYNPTTKTCSNVYCHSNGNPRVIGIDWKDASHETPSWNNGRNLIQGKPGECINCHESGNTLLTNAHYAHVTTSAIKCYVCHADTVNSMTAITDRSKHANGTKDVVFVTQPDNYMGIFTASNYDYNNATCTNSCHMSATPVWTNSATGACGTCHIAVPETSLHPAHFTNLNGPKLGANPDCASCHIYASGASTHANGEINLKTGNSCDPCHPAAKGTPIWSTAASVTCESCHNGPITSYIVNPSGSYTASPKSSNGHSQYSSAALKHVKCTTCHDATADHIGAGAAQKRLLLSGNALCNTCHTTAAFKGLSTAHIDMLNHGAAASKPPVTDAFANYTTTNDGRASECSGCHDTHGTSNLSAIRTSINGQSIVYTDRSAGFYVSSPITVNGNDFYNGLCQVCHTKTKYFRNNVDPSASLAHTQGDNNCMKCHYHKSKPTETVMFAFQGKGGGCGGCHGYPPATPTSLVGLKTIGNYSSAKLQSYSGGGGAHTVTGHLPRNIRQGQEWNNCTNCHYGNTATHNVGGTPIKRSYVNVIVDPKFKFKNDTSITYNSNASNCSNVSCHFKPSPGWTNGQQ
jgi:predicted CxxxxCH...CXXCH cytochrome family protein